MAVSSFVVAVVVEWVVYLIDGVGDGDGGISHACPSCASYSDPDFPLVHPLPLDLQLQPPPPQN